MKTPPSHFSQKVLAAAAAVLLVFGRDAKAEITIPLGNTAQNLAWDYSTGSQFHNGAWAGSIAVGNINSLPTRVRSFLKFDLLPLNGKTISGAVLSVPTKMAAGMYPETPHAISVALVEYDAGSGAFGNSPELVSRAVVTGTTANVTPAHSTWQVDVTALIHEATKRGYRFATIRLNDKTADEGTLWPCYVLFNPSASLAVTEAASIALKDPANDIAWDYLGGGNFRHGSWNGSIPTGNLNTLPTRVQSFLKFDISALAGKTVSSASLNLPGNMAETMWPDNAPHNIGVKFVDYSAGSGTFSNSPLLLNRPTIAAATFNVTNSGTGYSANVTTAVQTALSRGYSHAVFRVNNNTADSGTTRPLYVLFSSSATLSVAEPTWTLVENGVSKVSIHYASPSPTAVEIYAANLLRTGFGVATGALPSITPQTPAAIQIRLGTSPNFQTGVGDADEQAYRCRRTNDHKIELVANSPQGVLWAVDDFCRNELKVTWPVADGQAALIGPLRPTLILGRLDRLQKPDFSKRGWIIGDNANGLNYNDLICDWMARTRQNLNFTFYHLLGHPINAQAKRKERGIEADTSIHSFANLIPADEYGVTHPEYFPLIAGARRIPGNPAVEYPQLCLSNPSVLQISVAKARQTLDAYPEITTFGVVQNDGNDGWCQCSGCVAWDGAQAGTGVFSNRLITFVNLVAQQVAQTHPSKMIGTLAYGQTVVPPSIAVRNNVAITMTTGGRNYMKKLNDPADTRNSQVYAWLTGWLAKASHVKLWEYYYFSGIDRCASPWARTLCAELPDLKALGVKGIASETVPSMWKGMSLFSYAFSRNSWDSSLTYDQIIADFCRERYGPGADAMEQYHRFYEDTIFAKVPVMEMKAAGEQLFTKAFQTTEINTLSNMLITAENQVAQTGSSYHQGQVAKEKQLLESFKQLRIDPATKPGAGSNLVPSPGAETLGPWAFDVRRGNYTGTRPLGGAYQGTYTFRIRCNTSQAGWSRWYCPISGLTPGHKYGIRVWVKATAGAWGEIWVKTGGAQASIAYMDTKNLWAMLVIPEFVASETSGYLYLNAFGTEDVYFDAMYIGKIP
jgi:hypothetical protein